MTFRPLAERTWREHSNDATRTLLVPLGSFEQHGPHLPLTTDTVIATALSRRVAERVDVDVAPAIPFGASGEHQGFSGLISLGTDVVATVVLELLRSTRESWQRVVLINGHGGNMEAVHRVLPIATAEGSDVAAWFPIWRGGDPHAGEVETSVMLALDPTVVRRDVIADYPLHDGDMRAVREQGIMAVSPTGVLGSPSRATAALGQRVLDQWVEEIVTLVRDGEERV